MENDDQIPEKTEKKKKKPRGPKVKERDVKTGRFISFPDSSTLVGFPFDKEALTFKTTKYNKVHFSAKCVQMHINKVVFLNACIKAFLEEKPEFMAFLDSLPPEEYGTAKAARKKVELLNKNKDKATENLVLNDQETADMFDIIARDGPEV